MTAWKIKDAVEFRGFVAEWQRIECIPFAFPDYLGETLGDEYAAALTAAITLAETAIATVYSDRAYRGKFRPRGNYEDIMWYSSEHFAFTRNYIPPSVYDKLHHCDWRDRRIKLYDKGYGDAIADFIDACVLVGLQKHTDAVPEGATPVL